MTRHRRITPTKRQKADMLALGFEWRDFHQAFCLFSEPNYVGHRTIRAWVFPPMHHATRYGANAHNWLPRNLERTSAYNDGPGVADPITAATWLLIESAST